MQHPDPATVANREHPADRAGRLQLSRLDGEHQALLVVDLHLQDVHVGNVEDRIGPGTPTRTRTTRKWSLPILKAPTPSPADQHAHLGAPVAMLISEEPLIALGIFVAVLVLIYFTWAIYQLLLVGAT
jgi:hypothetical protein